MHSLFFYYTNNMNPKQEEEEEEEERSNVSTNLALSFNVFLNVNNESEKVSTKKEFPEEEISWDLKLYDDSWISNPSKKKRVGDHNSAICNETSVFATLKQSTNPLSKPDRTVDSEITWLKFHAPQEEEERVKGISTSLNLYEDPWKIKKNLTISDIGSLCRLMLKTEMVKTHILQYMNSDKVSKIESKEGERFEVIDDDTKSKHQMVLRKWSTSKSYVFNDKWSQHFVKRRGLKVGDEVGIYWDYCKSVFHFSLLTKRN